MWMKFPWQAWHMSQRYLYESGVKEKHHNEITKNWRLYQNNVVIPCNKLMNSMKCGTQSGGIGCYRNNLFKDIKIATRDKKNQNSQ